MSVVIDKKTKFSLSLLLLPAVSSIIKDLVKSDNGNYVHAIVQEFTLT